MCSVGRSSSLTFQSLYFLLLSIVLLSILSFFPPFSLNSNLIMFLFEAIIVMILSYLFCFITPRSFHFDTFCLFQVFQFAFSIIRRFNHACFANHYQFFTLSSRTIFTSVLVFVQVDKFYHNIRTKVLICWLILLLKSRFTFHTVMKLTKTLNFVFSNH